MADTRKPTKTKPRQPDKGKLARGAAARRLEEKRRRQRTLLWSAVAVVTLLGLIVFMGRDEPQAQNQPVAADALAAGREQAGSQGVKTFAIAGRDHIQPNEQPGNWNSTPPT